MVPRRTHKLQVVAKALTGDAQRLVMCWSVRDQIYFLLGGTLAPAECVRTCLARELQEEIALDATIGPFVGCIENHWQDEQHTYQAFNFIFRVQAPAALLDSTITSQLPHIAFEVVALDALLQQENVLPTQLKPFLAQHRIADDEPNRGLFLEQNLG